MGIKIYTHQDIQVAIATIDSAANIVTSLGFEDEQRSSICGEVAALLRDVGAILAGKSPMARK